MNIIEAVNSALHLEMERDERVMVLGEDVGKFGGVFRATKGLYETFGKDRSMDTPLSDCLLYTSPSPRDQRGSRMPSSA